MGLLAFRASNPALSSSSSLPEPPAHPHPVMLRVLMSLLGQEGAGALQGTELRGAGMRGLPNWPARSSLHGWV